MAITDKVAKMTDSWRRDKGRLDHTAHKEIADPACILPIGFVPLLGFGVLGMRENHLAGLFEHIEDRNPVLAGGFHTHFRTAMLMKPVSQTPEILWKRREASLIVIGTGMGIGNPDTGIDPGFVDIKPTAVVSDDFEHKSLLLKLQAQQGLAVRRNRVNFGRDKFTGYCFAPIIDAFRTADTI